MAKNSICSKFNRNGYYGVVFCADFENNDDFFVEYSLSVFSGPCFAKIPKAKLHFWIFTKQKLKYVTVHYFAQCFSIQVILFVTSF